MEFSKRVAVITGGGSGIGRAVAAAMGRRDVAAVALVDVSEAVEDKEVVVAEDPRAGEAEGRRVATRAEEILVIIPPSSWDNKMASTPPMHSV